MNLIATILDFLPSVKYMVDTVAHLGQKRTLSNIPWSDWSNQTTFGAHSRGQDWTLFLVVYSLSLYAKSHHFRLKCCHFLIDSVTEFLKKSIQYLTRCFDFHTMIKPKNKLPVTGQINCYSLPQTPTLKSEPIKQADTGRAVKTSKDFFLSLLNVI